MTGECVDACLGNHYESNFFPISSVSCDMVTVKRSTAIRLKAFIIFDMFCCKVLDRHLSECMILKKLHAWVSQL